MLGAFILLLVLCTAGWTAQARNYRDSFTPADVSTPTLSAIPQVTVFIQTTTTSREREWLEATSRALSETNNYTVSNDTERTDHEVQNNFLPGIGDGGGLHARPRNLTSHLGNQPRAASETFQSSSNTSSISGSTSPQTIATALTSSNSNVSSSVSKIPSSNIGVASPTALSSSAAATNLTQLSSPSKTDEIILSCILLYVVQDRDTCVSITGEFRFSLDTLFRLNPRLDPRCGNLQIGQYLCLRDDASSASPSPSPSTGIHGTVTTTKTTPTMTRASPTTAAGKISTTTASSRPFNNCQTYTVKSHETCEIIAERNKLSMKDFMGLNPDLKVLDDGNCPLDVGQSVCVKGPSGAPTTPTSTTQPDASSTQGKPPSTPASKGDHGKSHTPTSLEVVPIEPTGV